MATSSNDQGIYNHWNPIYTKNPGLSTITESQMHSAFNITALAPYRQMPEAYMGHVFMCRPNLCLSDTNLTKLKQLPTTSGLLTSAADKEAYLRLSSRSKSKWLPIITNKAKNYSVIDMELKNVDKGETYYGHTIKYAKHNEEFKHGGSITLEFRNDAYRSILKSMWFWACYMYNVTREDYLEIPFDDMWYGQLNYDASLFYLVTKRDGRELVYWEELVGVHPRRIPLSDFSWSDNFITTDTVSIDFDYSIRRDPLDTGILADINCLSINAVDANKQTIIRPDDRGEKIMNDILSNGPVIKYSTTASGERAYFLEYLYGGVNNDNIYLTNTNY